MAKAAPLTELADSELFERLAQGKAELFNLRFQLATGQLDNTARLGHVKKDVARCLTFMITQPAHAAVNEIMVRPTAQEH